MGKWESIYDQIVVSSLGIHFQFSIIAEKQAVPPEESHIILSHFHQVLCPAKLAPELRPPGNERD